MQNVIQMALKYFFYQKIKNSNRGFAPDFRLYDWVAALCSARHPIQTFFKQKNFNIQTPSLAKSWLHARLWVCRVK